MNNRLKESLSRFAQSDQDKQAAVYSKGVVNGKWWILKGTSRHLQCDDEQDAVMMLDLLKNGLCDGCTSNDVIMASIRAGARNV